MIAKWVAILLLASPAGLAAGQQQAAQAQPAQQQSQSQDQDHQNQDPLAAAARRAREEKKSQTGPAKVWDNDNLPKSPGTISVVGEPGSESNGTTKSAEQNAAPAEPTKAAEKNAGSLEERKAALEKELNQAKAHLKSVRTDLDIASRTYQLDQQTFYGNPNYSSDTQGADKLKSEQSEIDAKKQEVDDLQKNVDDLTAKLQELDSESSKPTPN
jgi:hypothetical protein